MNKYDVSIIVSCYNCSNFVEKTIDSVLKQTYDINKIELLLINDGSTDDTLSIIKKYEKENIIIIDKENTGVSDTRNLGISKASGKYILFLDSDDYISNNTIADLISFFDKHYDEIDLVTYPIINFYPNGRMRKHSRFKKFDKGTGIYDLNEYYCLSQSTINVMIKNDKSNKFRTDLYYGEDEFFNTEILMKKKKIGYVEEASYYYRRHDNSVTSKKKITDLEEVYDYYNELLKKYSNHPYIQGSIVYNYKWRIQDDCVFPLGMTIEEKNVYSKKIVKKLKNIDFSLFNPKNMDFKNDDYVKLIALSQKKCIIDSNSIICDGKTIVEDIISINRIHRIELKKDIFHIFGELNTPYFYKNHNLELFAEIINKNNTVTTIPIELKYDLDWEKNYSRRYELVIDSNVKTIRFVLKDKSDNILLITKPIMWCSKSKIYGNYLVTINNKVSIRKKHFFDKLKNKVVKTKSIKFYLINFCSLFKKPTKIYFTDKDSELYKLYEFDNDRNKVFVSDASLNKYKLLLLSANKVITDKTFKEVVPFGKLSNKYIASSSFEIELFEEEGDNIEEGLH